MRQINKRFFKILPLSVVGLMVLLLVAGSWQILPVRLARAAQPLLTNADILDTNHDGTDDRITIYFSEPVTIIDGNAGDGLPTIGLTDGCILGDMDYAQVGTTTLIANLNGCTSGNTGITPTITYTAVGNCVTAGAICDDATVTQMANADSTIATDYAPPAIMSRETADHDSNGKIDRIDFTTTENLDDDFSVFTVAVTGYTVSSVDTGDTAHDNKFRVYLTENASTCAGIDQSGCDTDAIPDTQITGNTTLSDWNGADVGNNIALDVGTVAATDKALPIYMLGAYLNGDTAPSNPDTVGGGDSDVGTSIQSLTNCMVTPGGTAHQWDSGEDVYIDNDTDGFVSVGDTRVTAWHSGTYNSGSTVAGGDADIGGGFETLTECKVTGSDHLWQPGVESVYDDVDVSNTVTAGDSRIYYPSTPGNMVNVVLLLFSEPVTYANNGLNYDDSEWTGTPNDLTGFDVSSCLYGGWGCAGLIGSGFKGLAFDVTGTAANQTGVSGGTEPGLAYTYAAQHIQDMAAVPNNAADFSDPALYDAAQPVMVSAEYLDSDHDGTVDTIRTTWSENVTMGPAGGGSTSTAADWTIVPGSINAAFSSAPDNAVAGTTLDVLVTANAGETSGVVAPTISYNNGDNNNSVTDTVAFVNPAGTTPPSGPATVDDGAAPYGYDFSIDQSYVNIGNQTATSFTFSGAEIGDVWRYTITSSGGGVPILDNGIIATPTDNITPVDVSALPDGILTYSVTLADSFGNIGAPITHTVTKDTGAPTVISVTPSVTFLTYANVGLSTFTITIVYDETMDATGANDPTIDIHNPPQAGLSFSSGIWSPTNVANDTYTATYDFSDHNETVYNIDIDVSGAKDPAGNTQTAHNSVDILAIDTQNPTVVSALTYDSDGNGQIDQLRVTYSEPVTDIPYNAVAVTGYAGLGTGSAVGNALYYNLTESGSFDTGATPPLTWTAANGVDGAGNILDTSLAPAVATDGAAPVIRNFAYQDRNFDGKIDRFTLTYSEPVVAASVLSADDLNLFADGGFTGAGFGSDLTDLITGTTSHTIVNLGFEATAVLTHESSPIRIFTQSAFALQDAAGNINNSGVEQTQASYFDGASPVIVSTSPVSGATSIATTANVVVNFSEPMNTGTVTKTSAADPGGWLPVWSAGNSVVTYSHNNFVNSTLYTQQITAGDDMTGNSISASLVSNPWSFTTVASASGGGGSLSPVSPPTTPVTPPTTPAADNGLILQDPTPAPALPPQVTIGTLVKLANSGSVYFIDQDNRRHAFPNESVYLSYYPDFSGVQTISDAIMAAIPLGSNVTLRPGTQLVKIQSDPKVYAVAPYGVLKWISTEQLAISLFGADWATRVVDVEPTFFINYQVGSSITTAIHPTGSVFSYQGDSKVYYVDQANKRYVSSPVFINNKFQNKFVIRNLAATITYPDGADLPNQGMETIMTLR